MVLLTANEAVRDCDNAWRKPKETTLLEVTITDKSGGHMKSLPKIRAINFYSQTMRHFVYLTKFYLPLLILFGLCWYIWSAFWRDLKREESVYHIPKFSPQNTSSKTPNTKMADGFVVSGEEFKEIEDCVQKFSTYRKYDYGPLIGQMNRDRFEGHNFLNANSTVLEIGGYTGVDASILRKLYHPWYHILEPMPQYFKELVKQFGNDTKFSMYNFGLGRENRTLYLSGNGDAASVFKTIGKAEGGTRIEIRNITEFLHGLGVLKKKIDYLQVNCEGCEYETLEVLLESGMVEGFRNLAFQFHLDLPGIQQQELRFCTITHLLHRTHHPRWQYRYVWQSWTEKSPPKIN